MTKANIEMQYFERWQSVESCPFCYCECHGLHLLKCAFRAVFPISCLITGFSPQDFVRSQGRSVGTHITFLTEGSETTLFRSYFDRWPQKVEPKLYEEGRGKVAGVFVMQQSYTKKK